MLTSAGPERSSDTGPHASGRPRAGIPVAYDQPVAGPTQTDPEGEGASEALPRDLLDTSAAGPTAIRGSLLRTGGYVASAVVGLVSVSLVIRELGVVDFGHYVTVLSLVTLAATLSDAGLTTLAIREYSVRTAGERDRLMANLLGLRLVLTTLGVLGAVAFGLAAGYESRLLVGTLIAGWGILLLVLQGTYAVPLTSMLRLGVVTALDFGRQVLNTLLTLGLVLAGGTLLAFLAVPIPIGIAMLVLTAWLVRGQMPMMPRADLGEWRELLRTLVPLGLATAVGAIYFRVTIITMSLVASEQQTGYYATSYRVLEVVVALPALIVASAFPLLARAARDDTRRLTYAIQRLSEAMTIFGGWVALVIVLGAPFAIEVLTGGGSDPSIPVLQIQAVAIAVVCVATTWWYALLSLGRFDVVVRITSVGLVVVLGTTLLLVPHLEAQGAAIAIVAGDTTQALLAFLVVRRSEAQIRFPVRTTLCVLLGCGLALTTLLVPGLGSLACALIGTAIYVATILALRAMPEELMQAFRERLARG